VKSRECGLGVLLRIRPSPLAFQHDTPLFDRWSRISRRGVARPRQRPEDDGG